MSYFERRFVAIQKCTVPRSAEFSEEQVRESLQLVTRFLREKPSGVRFKLVLFLIYIDALSMLRGAKSFPELEEEKQRRILKGLFDSKVPLIRKGFWGLNTLARLGVYGQPSVYPSLNYRLRPAPHE
jgi:hypothetical protein